ncbi:MAG: branched-chain amino acid ABC transporter permease, partial [Pseudomonadota bacterium]
LGAIGLTMMMHILRFANFSHAELLSIGAYVALVFDKTLSALAPVFATKWGNLSLTTALAGATLVAMAITGGTAVLADKLVFKRLREQAGPLTMVFASFGVALIMRNVIGLVFGLSSQHYSNDIAFAVMVSTDPFLLIKPDQLAVLALALVAMVALHMVMTRTPLGFALQAISENPTLAQVNGVNLKRMVIITWLIGGGLAALAGVSYALTHQLSPVMGRDLVLSLFAAAILGGLGSIPGAVIGGFVVGLASSLALLVIPAGYKPAIPFLIILVALYVRPNGLFGAPR